MVQAEGDALAVQDALRWYLTALENFQPTRAEIERVRQMIIKAHQEEQQDFPATLAMKDTRELLNRSEHLTSAVIRHVDDMSLAEVLGRTHRSLSGADLVAAFSGDFNEGDVQAVVGAVREYFPRTLTAGQRQRRSATAVAINRSTGFYAPRLAEGEGAESVGLSRTYPSAERSSVTDQAIIAVLVETLNQAVFRLNRAERQLGYVHGVTATPVSNQLYVSFMGQVSDPAKFELMEDGWAQVIQRLRDGTLSADHFESEKNGVQLSMAQSPDSPVGAALQLLLSMQASGGNPLFHEEVARRVGTLTEEEIRTRGLALLAGDAPTLSVFFGNKPRAIAACEEWLTNARDTRARLSGR